MASKIVPSEKTPTPRKKSKIHRKNLAKGTK